MRVHHIAILARDVDAIAAFYRDLLRLPEVARHHDAQGLRSIWLQVDDTILMVERADQPTVAGAWHLVAFAIPRHERDEWVARLRAAEAGPTGETGFTLYGRDPEGNPFGLSHYPDPVAG